MTEKCILCEEKIEKLFLDKIDGTIIKVKKENKNKEFYVCSSCQKEAEKQGQNLKKKVEEKAG